MPRAGWRQEVCPRGTGPAYLHRRQQPLRPRAHRTVDAAGGGSRSGSARIAALRPAAAWRCARTATGSRGCASAGAWRSPCPSHAAYAALWSPACAGLRTTKPPLTQPRQKPPPLPTSCPAQWRPAMRKAAWTTRQLMPTVRLPSPVGLSWPCQIDLPVGQISWRPRSRPALPLAVQRPPGLCRHPGRHGR